MAVYRRSSRIDAPLDEVWEFHSTIDGLVELTPGFMNLRVESVVGPDGEHDPGILEEGARIDLSMRPLGIGPRQSWTSVITERERGDGAAYFKDAMEGGAFPRWVHTHRFDAEGAGTRMTDRVEYELPGLGPASPVGWPGFEAMFAYRHRRTRQVLE